MITPLGPKYPDPSGSTFSTGTQIYSGLINGSYNFQVTDQIGNTVLVQYIVEGCVDTVINSFSGTTCGAENGSITALTSSINFPYNLSLYRDNLLYSETSFSARNNII